MQRLRGTSLIAGAIVLGAIILALGAALRPQPDRYRFDVTNAEVRRLDTATGDVRVCMKDTGCFSYDMDAKDPFPADRRGPQPSA